jgi:excisionase family DNA binding protein
MKREDNKHQSASWTVAQAASELGVIQNTVRRAIKDGRLPARKVLGRYRLDAADVKRAAAGVSYGEETANVG